MDPTVAGVRTFAAKSMLELSWKAKYWMYEAKADAGCGENNDRFVRNADILKHLFERPLSVILATANSGAIFFLVRDPDGRPGLRPFG